MAQNVRRHVRQARRRCATLRNALSTSLTGLPFHSTAKRWPEPLPASQVRQKPVRQRNGRAALFRLALALRAAVEDAPIEIDPSPALGRLECGGTNGAGPRAGVERDQDESRDVPPRPPIGRLALLRSPGTATPPSRSWAASDRVSQRSRPTGVRAGPR